MNGKRLLAAAFALALFAPLALTAQKQPVRVAKTPPLGWNSWDSYGMRINEQQFRDNVVALRDKLKSFGYTYAVIDEGWYMQNPEDRPKPELLKYAIDGNGRFIPVPVRFATALTGDKNTGFEQLGAWVHAQGLKFGIHIIRGIPRQSVDLKLPIEGSKFTVADAADTTDACPWDPTSWGVKDNAAGQAWYDSLLSQYAKWGVDYLKVDCIADHPYKASEIRQIHLAIQHSGRPMVLSLSPGPTQLEHQPEVAKLAQMWRISDDVWDLWSNGKNWPRGVSDQFAPAAAWAKYARPGNWPDADMLPLGDLSPWPDVGPGARHTRLTPAEQQTQVSLWAMARSPFIVGANLLKLDAATLALLTNPEILKIDQHALASREVLHDGDLIAWSADLPKGERALAVFNLSDKPMTISRRLVDFKLPAGAHALKNAWSGEALKASSKLDVTLEPHASMVLMLAK